MEHDLKYLNRVSADVPEVPVQQPLASESRTVLPYGRRITTRAETSPWQTPDHPARCRRGRGGCSGLSKSASTTPAPPAISSWSSAVPLAARCVCFIAFSKCPRESEGLGSLTLVLEGLCRSSSGSRCWDRAQLASKRSLAGLHVV